MRRLGVSGPGVSASLALLLVPLAVRGELAAPRADSTLAGALGDSVAVRRAPRVPWLTDTPWSEVVSRASATGRPILIDFTATWCGPCKLLDVMVFTEKSVIAELADVVTLKVDIDRPGADDLPRLFGVEIIPTIVWCDAAGRERDRFTGYVSSSQFLNAVTTWRDGLTMDQSLARRQAAAPEAPEVLLAVARRHASQNRPHEAEVAYRRLLNLRHIAEPAVVARGMLGLAEMERAAGRVDRAGDLTQRAAAVFLPPAHGRPLDETLGGLLEVATFQAAVGDTADALDTWQQMIALDDRNAAVLEGFARIALAANIRLEDATRAALRAVVFSDKDAAVLAVLAECYYRRRMFTRAERWIAQAIARDPDEPSYVARQEVYAAARRGERVRFGR